MPTLPYALLRVINYAGDPHAPGTQIAATIWRPPQLLLSLFCICSSVTAAWNPVNARKSKWPLCFRLFQLCRVCGCICIRLWRLTASRPVPQSGASLSADKDAFSGFYFPFCVARSGIESLPVIFEPGPFTFLCCVKGGRCVPRCGSPPTGRGTPFFCFHAAFSEHKKKMARIMRSF